MLENLSRSLSYILKLLTQSGLSEDNSILLITIYCIVTVSVMVAIYVMKTVAIALMAKKQGMKKWGLAFLPYYNFVVLGKLSGRTSFFRFSVKNVGVICALALAANHLFLLVDSVAFLLYSAGQTAFTVTFYQVTTAVYSMINFPIGIVQTIAFISLCLGVFSKYAPDKRLLFTLLSLIDIAFPILLLVIHNKKPFNSYNDYLRWRSAERFGQTYNPFDTPYETTDNPFVNNNDNSSKNESPFDEY